MKLISWLLMFFAAAAAGAEWIPATRTDEFAIYQDAASVRKDGSVVYLTELRDFDKPYVMFNGNTVSSQIHTKSYDCASGKSRLTRAAFFSSRMGMGDPGDWNDAPQAPWLPIENGSPVQEAMKFACARFAP